MNRREMGRFALAGAAALTAFSGAPSAASAEDASLGSILAVIAHPVADYAAGVTGAEVFIDATDPLMVVVLHRFPSMEAAQGFFSDPALIAGMQRAGVTAPPTIIFATAT
jgi:hypothetical protein